MAAVYAATHRNELQGAVKILHPEVARLSSARDRFLKEGYAANRVRHPGAVCVLDDDVTEDGSVFLVMELLTGMGVDALAEASPGRRLPLGQVLFIADALLEVLHAAHDKGIVHRDLKPENLFVTNDGELKVLDFGIARLREANASARATATGQAMGTPAFMPPEQAAGKWELGDARSDLWAVAATMFTLLTGRIVHHAETVSLVLVAATTRPAPSIAVLRPDLPAAVCAVIDRALAFRPEDRWQTARDMQGALREAASGDPTKAVGAVGGLTMHAHGSAAAAIGTSGETIATDPQSPRAAPEAMAATGVPVTRRVTARRPASPRLLVALLATVALGSMAVAWWRWRPRPDPVVSAPPEGDVAAPAEPAERAHSASVVKAVEPVGPPSSASAAPSQTPVVSVRPRPVVAPQPAPPQPVQPPPAPSPTNIFKGRK